jgi:hypothetical protein
MISENASFREFAQLRVPNSRDRWSDMTLRQLLATIPEADVVQQKIFDLWLERNTVDTNKNYVLTEKELKSVLRWHLRGLTIGAAIKKVRVDYETTLNAGSKTQPSILHVDQRVQLPSGRTGTVLVSPGGELMPNHALVQIDDSDCIPCWLSADILQPTGAAHV